MSSRKETSISAQRRKGWGWKRSKESKAQTFGERGKELAPKLVSRMNGRSTD